MDWCLISMVIKIKNILIFSFALLPVSAMSYAELPDPTRPPDYNVASTEPVYVEAFDENTKEKMSWTLSAIRISKKDKTAIVNGKLVRVGDDINQAKVLEINSQSVVINHDAQRLIVRLFNNRVIKDYNSSNTNLRKK